jgi:ATP-dependent Zn protease
MLTTEKDKKRLAIHEAGHAAMYLLWRVPWQFASMASYGAGLYHGEVHRKSYLLIGETQERFFVKDWSIAMAGLMAEQIFLKRKINWKLESPGSIKDLRYADTEALKRMSREHYKEKFGPLVMKLTHESLKKNWDNCVMIIADELCMWDRTTPEQLKPLIKLDYPSEKTLDDIMQATRRKT